VYCLVRIWNHSVYFVHHFKKLGLCTMKLKLHEPSALIPDIKKKIHVVDWSPGYVYCLVHIGNHSACFVHLVSQCMMLIAQHFLQLCACVSE